MYYKTYKNLIEIYDNNENLVHTIVDDRGNILISCYDEKKKIKYPILSVANGSECVMCDELTIFFGKDKKQRDMVQLTLERESTKKIVSFYLVYNKKKHLWIDFVNKMP